MPGGFRIVAGGNDPVMRGALFELFRLDHNPVLVGSDRQAQGFLAGRILVHHAGDRAQVLVLAKLQIYFLLRARTGINRHLNTTVRMPLINTRCSST